MKINNTRLHNSNVLLATCDEVDTLRTEMNDLANSLLDDTNWIEAPTKQEKLTVNRLIERYNTKIIDLLELKLNK